MKLKRLSLFLLCAVLSFNSCIKHNKSSTDTSSVDNDVKKTKPINFISKWKIGEEIDEDKTIVLPIYNGGDYDFHVDWGDGTEKQHINSDNLNSKSHTYKAPGEYSITITGKIKGFNFGLVDKSRSKIIEILDWGNLNFGHNENGAYFKNCRNLTTIPSLPPDLEGITNMKDMFNLCFKLNGDVSNWDVSKVTDMSSMFFGCNSFTGKGLKTWDVSNVTNVRSMFSLAISVTEDLSGWNVNKVNACGDFVTTKIKIPQRFPRCTELPYLDPSLLLPKQLKNGE
ncbi:BspA family leucine-rich repeat surface protein [Ichthyobacterium seriolicida]|nr:BspA family leucine-rich repeat surface protein [Ichthyobacterium seriolicida]